jgi:hypothetical protein
MAAGVPESGAGVKDRQGPPYAFLLSFPKELLYGTALLRIVQDGGHG